MLNELITRQLESLVSVPDITAAIEMVWKRLLILESFAVGTKEQTETRVLL